MTDMEKLLEKLNRAYGGDLHEYLGPDWESVFSEQLATVFQPSKLDEAIGKILRMGDKDLDPWTKLCIATIKLGAALAEFDNARKEYVESQKEDK